MLNNYNEFVSYSLKEMKTDGEKRQMVKTVKFSYWLILLLFCTKKQNNKKRLFVSIIWGEAVEGIKNI